MAKKQIPQPVQPAMTNNSPFPDWAITAAQAAQKATKCWASLSLSMFALESDYGRKIPPDSFNYFGVKSSPGSPYPSIEVETKEYYPATKSYRDILAAFVKYPDANTAFLEHAKLLTNPKGPYNDCLPYLYDVFKFTQRIGPIYATMPGYAQTLLELMGQYNLFVYDKVA